MRQFAVRGVIEGFYGNPWSHQQRLDMFEFMHTHGFNAFVYAPKDDPFHRERWRDPYPERPWQRIVELIRRAAQLHVDFCFAVSPGLSLRYSDDGEVDALVAKCVPLYEQQVRTFGVFLDDIPFDLKHDGDKARYGSLVEAQVDYLKRVYGRLQQVDPGIRLIVCPTVYCYDPDVPYIEYMGEHLPRNVDIFWTGPQVCSTALSTDYTQRVAGVMRRPPLYWDNYPVNDANMTAELHIGPYLNRDADLYTAARGLYANPMELAEASKLALATIGAYLSDPGHYDPGASWRAAAEELAGPELAEALAVFAESNTVSCLSPGDPPALVELFARLAKYRTSFRHREARQLLAAAVARMEGAADTLAGARPHSRLIQEMAPWLEEYQQWVALLKETVVRREERHERRAARARIRRGLEEAVRFRTKVCGHAVDDFLKDYLWATADRNSAHEEEA